MKCINKNLEPIKELLNDFKEPVLSKILDSFPDDYIPTKEEALKKYSELLGSSVDYKLKVINALQSDKVRQPNKNFQGFLNDLQKQGVPKDQIELLNQVYQEGDSKEDLISTMLANYSYTIEINTAKGGKGEYDLNVDNFYTGFKKFERNGKYFISYLEQISDTDYETIEKEVTKEEYKSYEKPNTQYYSNLTVPGGQEGTYREVKFDTPQITPSIKAHAQFASNNTIFWTREADRKVYNSREDIIEKLKSSGQLKIEC